MNFDHAKKYIKIFKNSIFANVCRDPVILPFSGSVLHRALWQSILGSGAWGRGEEPKIPGISFRRFFNSCLNRRGEPNPGSRREGSGGNRGGGRNPLSRRRRLKKIIIAQLAGEKKRRYLNQSILIDQFAGKSQLLEEKWFKSLPFKFPGTSYLRAFRMIRFYWLRK